MRSSRLAVAAAAAVVLAAGLLPAVSTTSSAAPAPDPSYRPLAGFKPSGDKVRVAPQRYSAVRVDLDAVRDELRAAPPEGAGGAVVFRVPTPSGGTERFSVTRTDVLAPELAAAHPEIATYAGRSLDDPSSTIALDVTPMGLHAAVRGATGTGTWYVDPAYDRRGTTEHLAFYANSTTRPEEAFAERQAPEVHRELRRDARATNGRGPGDVVVQKRYRLALTSDPSYAAYFGTGNVLAEKATLINRVNQIYQQDLAISLQLISQTDELNFDTEAEATGPDGPCGAEPCFRSSIYPGDPDDYGDLDFCSTETLGRNRIVLGQVVGASSYDVGHIALGKNGGGVAYLDVVGRDRKGGGCTGIPEPKGDFFAIDYVAHEIGHQFGGQHTFNGVQYACSGSNRNGGTSVEPGSGSSVMAYAGICLQDDLQPHTDPYFSFATLDQVNAFTARRVPRVVEVQTVSLSGFGAPGSSVTLGFEDAAPVQIDAGDDRRAIETKLEGLTDQNVTVAPWGYDAYATTYPPPGVYPAPVGEPGDTGFQVIFAGSARPTVLGEHTDKPSITVLGGSPGVTGFVGETAQGGPAENDGVSTVTLTNRAPRITRASVTRRIPVRTPFMLTGTGRDPDGDSLVYLWEQTDPGRKGRNQGTSLVSNKKIYGPLFRVFGQTADVSYEDSLESPSPGINVADGETTRMFPDLLQVLSGNTNARTGACPRVEPVPSNLDDYAPPAPAITECYSEYLPTKKYLGTYRGGRHVMHFRLTARDGRGGVAHRAVRLRVVPRAGPFLVTSQARKNATVAAGSAIDVTWKVNGTRALSKKVVIYLSTNGGRTWKRTLAAATPNDGSATVTVPPGVRTSKARIVVAAKGSYFYAVNEQTFRIR